MPALLKVWLQWSVAAKVQKKSLVWNCLDPVDSLLDGGVGPKHRIGGTISFLLALRSLWLLLLHHDLFVMELFDQAAVVSVELGI
jgi:hypothetical protein